MTINRQISVVWTWTGTLHGLDYLAEIFASIFILACISFIIQLFACMVLSDIAYGLYEICLID